GERAPGSAALSHGAIVNGETARMLACDAGLCRVITRGASEVLDVGRATREWNPAQRRAIMHRHAWQCAFPGCGRRILQIHHAQPWDDDGATDINNGVPLCAAHHRLVHHGKWTVFYSSAQRAAIFTGPNNEQVIATAVPKPWTIAA